MPGQTGDFGRYNARGIRGGEALQRQLDRLVTYFASPVTSPRGLAARLNYLLNSPTRLAAARQAGLTVTDRTLKAWRDGMRKPNKANLQRIDDVYRKVRRRNVARQLLKRLQNGGAGTRIEIHPQNQSQVPRPHQRALSFRTLNVRRWDAIVAAWAGDDVEQLHALWIDLIQDLGSEWGMYEYVTNVGFAA